MSLSPLQDRHSTPRAGPKQLNEERINIHRRRVYRHHGQLQSEVSPAWPELDHPAARSEWQRPNDETVGGELVGRPALPIRLSTGTGVAGPPACRRMIARLQPDIHRAVRFSGRGRPGRRGTRGKRFRGLSAGRAQQLDETVFLRHRSYSATLGLGRISSSTSLVTRFNLGRSRFTRPRNESGIKLTSSQATFLHGAGSGSSQTESNDRRQNAPSCAEGPMASTARKVLLTATDEGREAIRSVTASRQAWLAKAIDTVVEPDEYRVLAQAIDLLNRLAECELDRPEPRTWRA